MYRPGRTARRKESQEMTRTLLLQLDGALPNLALMHLARHCRDRGDEVELRRAPNAEAVEPQLGDRFDEVYASLIFQRTQPVARRLLDIYPRAVIGGTGWNFRTLEQIGVRTRRLDYSDYPGFRQSIGFTQR